MNIKRSNIKNRITTILLVFCVTFIAIPLATGGLSAHAVSKPTRVTGLKGSGTGKTTIRITWKKMSEKQLKHVSGYAVYRNNKFIGRVGKNTNVYTDRKLKSGKTYSYKVYSYRTYKQYYNSRSRRWQYKKPASRNWRGKKTRKKYIFGKASAVKYVKTKSASDSSTSDKLFSNSKISNQTVNIASNPTTIRGKNTIQLMIKTSKYATWSSSNSNVAVVTPYNDGKEGCVYIRSVGSVKITAKNWNGDTKSATIKVVNKESNEEKPSQPETVLSEDNTTYIEFSDIRLTMGQAWSSTLESQIAAKSNGRATYTRAGSSSNNNKTEKIYMFNTNTYNPFLAVYVTDGKISGWGSNDSTLGVIKNRTITRGMNRSGIGANSGYGVLSFYTGISGDQSVYVLEVYRSHGVFTNNAIERNIGFHYVNAARVTLGKTILIRDKYLEGVDENGNDLTYTGRRETDWYLEDENDINSLVFIYTDFDHYRYGAQGWAETMYNTKKVGHYQPGVYAAPCGEFGCDYGPADCLDNTSKDLYNTGECVAGGSAGETAIFAYSGSSGHCNVLLADKPTRIGLGFCNGYNCIKLGYYWDRATQTVY